MKLRLVGTLLVAAACDNAMEPLASPYELLFAGDRDGRVELYATTLDASEMAHLTDHPGADRAPRWSPDGRKIVFTSERDGIQSRFSAVLIPEIYVMNADGSLPIRLTQDSTFDADPDWSPDGRSIVFARYVDDGTEPGSTDQSYEIFQLNADGSQLRRITNTPGTPGDNFMPRWSPDGRRLAFLSNRGGFYSIYVLDVQSDSVWRVPRPYEDGNIWSYDWAPNGDSFVYAIDADRAIELYTAELDDSSRLRRLTTGIDIVNSNPVWSPLGTRIAFSSSRDYMNSDPFSPLPLNIYVLDVGTGDVRRVTHESGRDVISDWNPSGGT